MSQIKIYDTTLRDGNQDRNISFSLEDKLIIAKKLDELGVHYIEGGWPNASNPTDLQFFEEIRKVDLKHAKIAAFGSTRGLNITADEDPILKSLIDSKASVITIFGKTWDLHVTDIIKTTLAENLLMIEESISYLKKHCEEVVFDAEHFFDGYKSNSEFALSALDAAVRGGADCLVLCDTNGGMMPSEYGEIVSIVCKRFPGVEIGIHNHNDSGCAVANAIAGFEAGSTHVQGTINGIGERCGNADLCTIIANIELKLGYESIGKENLLKLTETSLFVNEVANIQHNSHLPYVGQAAFAHKGGAHIDGVLKKSISFEHVKPEVVGNERTLILSDQSGGATVVEKLKKIYPEIDKKDPLVKEILFKVKEMESQGYQFEVADGSFKLLAKKIKGDYQEPFVIQSYRVIEEKRNGVEPYSEATIKVYANDKVVHTAAEGDGPVNALDNAIRKALTKFYPQLASIHLKNYKVIVIEGDSGTSSKVRVIIESSDGNEVWGTVGVSENIIEASWIALIDSINYKLMKEL